mgnify:CR=1 FL=1
MPQSLSHIYWPLSDASTQRTIPDTWPTETEENPFWNRLKEKVTGYMTVEGKAYFIDEIDNYSNLVVLVNNKGEETIYTYAELEKLDLKNIPKPKKAFPKNKTEKGVVANLFEIHRADADLICKWTIDKNLIISEKFTI